MPTILGCSESRTISDVGISSSSCGVVRMGPDRPVNAVVLLDNAEQMILPPDSGRDIHHKLDTSFFGTRNDSVEILRELGTIDMAMVVDQHDAVSLCSLNRIAVKG